MSTQEGSLKRWQISKRLQAATNQKTAMLVSWDVWWTKWHWDRFISELFGLNHRENLKSYCPKHSARIIRQAARNRMCFARTTTSLDSPLHSPVIRLSADMMSCPSKFPMFYLSRGWAVVQAECLDLHTSGEFSYKATPGFAVLQHYYNSPSTELIYFTNFLVMCYSKYL